MFVIDMRPIPDPLRGTGALSTDNLSSNPPTLSSLLIDSDHEVGPYISTVLDGLGYYQFAEGPGVPAQLSRTAERARKRLREAGVDFVDDLSLDFERSGESSVAEATPQDLKCGEIMTTPDRRTTPRLNACGNSTIQVLGVTSDTNGLMMPASVIDISEGGMRLRAAARIHEGQAVKVEIGDAMFLGEVRYCVPAEAGDRASSFFIGIMASECLTGLAGLHRRLGRAGNLLDW